MTQFIKIIAPFVPFISETIYTMLKPYIPNSKESIHFDTYPNLGEFMFNETLEDKFNVIQKVITLIREIRDILKFNNRRPINYAEIGCVNPADWNIIQDIMGYVNSESNVLHIRKLEASTMIECKAEPIVQELSAYLKEIEQIKHIKHIIQFINAMDFLKILEFQEQNFIKEPLSGINLTNKYISVKYFLKNTDPACKMSDGIIVKLDGSYTDEVKTEHLVRLINTSIQMHRKSICLKPWQIIDIYYNAESELEEFISKNFLKFDCKNINSIVFREKNHMLDNKTTHEIIGKTLIICSKNA
jgi:isoleucyl-tRNA synthetase